MVAQKQSQEDISKVWWNTWRKIIIGLQITNSIMIDYISSTKDQQYHEKSINSPKTDRHEQVINKAAGLMPKYYS